MASIGVHVDADRLAGTDVEWLLWDLSANLPTGGPAARVHEIPVCYEPPFALDLEDVAGRCRCTTADVIAWHTAVEYRVFMIGFLPGFPYLGVVDARLALPRRSVPRERVPRGAVALAGQQTGIYPFESPGGWHVIGRTPVSLFDPAADPPFRLEAEDRVRFVSIPASRFDVMAEGDAG
jgi:inhibitor of KinA